MPYQSGFEQSELRQIHADIKRLRAETMRLHAASTKPVSDREIYRAVLVASILTSAGIALGVGLSFVL
ncbi:hypothetical protein [Pseudomonas sp. Pseu.R1]|uniref:hypothetical protein n=1 Tax=Pseudomonas sp. Pseu.R1 TaxID=3379818 RepID=UPI003B931DDE